MAKTLGKDGNSFELGALPGGYKADKDYASKTGQEIIIENMQNGVKVTLPAFLTSLDQNFDSSWNTEDVFGRMDPIATYQGTKRTVNFGVNIISRNFEDATKNHTKFSTLTKMVYPSYTKDNIMSKAPLVKIKFGSLICDQNGKGLLGYLNGFKYSYNQEMGYFINNEVSLPKVITTDFTLNVLHTNPLGNDGTKWKGGVANTRFPFGKLK